MSEIVKHIANSKPSYIREILSVTDSEDIISLAGGLPCPELFPMHIIEKALSDISQDSRLFQYAQSVGHPTLIHQLSRRYDLADTHGLMITSGSQQGIDLCIRAFIEKGDKVVVENPSYLGALQLFEMAQAHVLGVQQEPDGPNLVQLEAHFAKGNIKLFYAVPDFHNPTGCCWSLSKRESVAALCIKYDVALIEDAPYRKIRFSGDELPTVSSFCPNHAITLSSLSKLVSPALRVSSLIAPIRWFSAIIKIKQAIDLHTSVPMQQLAADILSHQEFDIHVEKICLSYKARYDALAKELNTLDQEKYSFQAVEGGMFVWLKVPNCDTLALANDALKQGVAVVPGSEFSVTKSSKNDEISSLRLNFSHNSVSRIQEGIRRLKPVLESYS